MYPFMYPFIHSFITVTSYNDVRMTHRKFTFPDRDEVESVGSDDDDDGFLHFTVLNYLMSNWLQQ